MAMASMTTLKTTWRAVKALYIFSTVTLGLSLALAMISVLCKRHVGTLGNVLFDSTASITVTVASVVASVVCFQAAVFLSKSGEETSEITAIRGDRFLILTWLSTGLIMCVSVVRSLACILRFIF
jgi:hypothetical protein